MDYVGSVQPSYVMVGGFIQPQTHTIPDQVQAFINSSDPHHGVILFSFGSIARNYGPKWREIFAAGLARLPHRVIWRYNEEVPRSLGNNTLLVPWLPQSEILAQPQVKLFVTHCGMNAAYEASYHGTPVVAIPLFADQFFQASKLINHVKMGQRVDIRKLDADRLYEAIMDVANNGHYAENAKTISYVMQNRPWSQKETILTWVNYVIMHKGAQHLLSREHELEWWQYLLLDVVAIVMGVLLIIVASIFFISRQLLRVVRRNVAYIMTTRSVDNEDKRLHVPEKNNNKDMAPH